MYYFNTYGTPGITTPTHAFALISVPRCMKYLSYNNSSFTADVKLPHHYSLQPWLDTTINTVYF